MNIRKLNEDLKKVLKEGIEHYSKEEKIKCSSMLRDIASTDASISKNDGFILLQAANILDDFTGEMVTGKLTNKGAKAFGLVNEAISFSGTKKDWKDFSNKLGKLKYKYVSEIPDQPNAEFDNEIQERQKAIEALPTYMEDVERILKDEGIEAAIRLRDHKYADEEPGTTVFLDINGFGNISFIINSSNTKKVDGKFKTLLLGKSANEDTNPYYIDVTGDPQEFAQWLIKNYNLG